jgi:hypothetical protein
LIDNIGSISHFDDQRPAPPYLAIFIITSSGSTFLWFDTCASISASAWTITCAVGVGAIGLVVHDKYLFVFVSNRIFLHDGAWHLMSGARCQMSKERTIRLDAKPFEISTFSGLSVLTLEDYSLLTPR